MGVDVGIGPPIYVFDPQVSCKDTSLNQEQTQERLHIYNLVETRYPTQLNYKYLLVNRDKSESVWRKTLNRT